MQTNKDVKDYEILSKKEVKLESTADITSLAGKRVLSRGGTIVGKISEVRVNSNNLELEGIIVRGKFDRPLFISKNYFSTLSAEAVILNTELSLLLKGKKVITNDGKLLGKVILVNRKAKTNEIESLLVRHLWKKYLISESEIEKIEDSILLKKNYDAAKDYIWKRPEQNTNI